MKAKHSFLIWGSLLLLGLCLIAQPAVARRPIHGEPFGPPPGNSGPELIPQSGTIDMVEHNKGNIITTIDNWGYMGGYQYYGYPSGEWPRNSGHDYIGEIRYWMGAVTPSGDTLVANTYDDFQGMSMPFDDEDLYQIYLSTDTTRFYSYDESDTTGLSTGNPAYGWKIWDPVTGSYAYNDGDPLSTAYVPSGPTSLQESFYRFNDAASGESLMGLELTHRIMQWNYCYNEDFTFVMLEITNTSDVDYINFAIGLYIDIDVGGPDGTGENGRLGDLVASDVSNNLAWIYDEDSYDPGWGRGVQTGVMGTKYIETPDGIGMTSFRTGYWEMVSDLDDPDMYELIAGDQVDESLPPTDQFYLQCTRGIALTAGRTVRIVYALIAGEDEDKFRENAALAQDLYDNSFVGPQPPATPVLSARSGDGKVYLNWTDTSEICPDPMTGQPDFVGYKLYRSDNQGKTWGTPIYDTGNDCLDMDYTPLVTYMVNEPGDPVQHSFIDDNGLFNGVEYWYCLVAFDNGDEVTGIDPLQSGFGIAAEVSNCISVTPMHDPAGFFDAAGTVVHNYVGAEQQSDGSVTPILFDEDLLTGSDYQVTFLDLEDATYWYLINVTTGDTILTQTRTEGDPGLYEVADGLRVVVRNGDRVPRSVGQTEFASGDTTLPLAAMFGPALPTLTGDATYVWGDAPYRCSYELRYTGESSRASWVGDGFYGIDNAYSVPFECWNTTTNQRVSMAVWDYNDNGLWDSNDDIAIVNYPYNADETVTPYAFPYHYSWLFNFDTTGFNPQIGDVFMVAGAPMNGPDDNFTFATDGISTAAASNEMSQIKVVPNPYFGCYDPLVETNDGEAVIKFIKVPDQCTIRIYTLAGDLVQTINHNDGTGEVSWNLLSSNRQQVASGIYLFMVESDYGEFLGRFAVIK